MLDYVSHFVLSSCRFLTNIIRLLPQVLVSSSKIVDGISRPYLVLDTNNMSAIVTMETWILSASAKLGGIELLDHLNKGNKFLGFLLFVRNNDENEKIGSCYKIRFKRYLLS